MATKKKAAPKAAKKAIPAKKSAPVKKSAVKAATNGKAASHGKASNGHSAKAATPAKKVVAAKPIAKAAASKKPVEVKPAKKAAEKPVEKPVVPSKATAKSAKPTVEAPAKAAAKPAVKEIKKSEPPKTPNKKAAQAEQPVAGAKAEAPVVPTPPPTPKKQEPQKPVKVEIPEMKTKSVKKYEPEFIKSVLDTPDTPQKGPTMRYSDAELQEFRELIQKKLDQAKKELTYLQGLITRKDEMGGDESENRYMTMEDGSMSMEREQLAQMASRQINYIDHLEKAIMRIENKTYGICRVTGRLIDKARLRAVPHATLSIEAKQMMNK